MKDIPLIGEAGDFLKIYANIEKVQKLLDYSPRTFMLEGLSDFKLWLLKQHI